MLGSVTFQDTQKRDRLANWSWNLKEIWKIRKCEIWSVHWKAWQEVNLPDKTDHPHFKNIEFIFSISEKTLLSGFPVSTPKLKERWFCHKRHYILSHLKLFGFTYSTIVFLFLGTFHACSRPSSFKKMSAELFGVSVHMYWHYVLTLNLWRARTNWHPSGRTYWNSEISGWINDPNCMIIENCVFRNRNWHFGSFYLHFCQTIRAPETPLWDVLSEGIVSVHMYWQCQYICTDTQSILRFLEILAFLSGWQAMALGCTLGQSLLLEASVLLIHQSVLLFCGVQ